MGASFHGLCIDLQGEAVDYGDTLPLEDWSVAFDLGGTRYYLSRCGNRVYFDKETGAVVVNIGD